MKAQMLVTSILFTVLDKVSNIQLKIQHKSKQETPDSRLKQGESEKWWLWCQVAGNYADSYDAETERSWAGTDESSPKRPKLNSSFRA